MDWIFGLVVLLGIGATYAINTAKIRMVATSRSLPAATLEAIQGFLYLYVIIRVVQNTNETIGLVAYVAGAFVGTLAAMKHMRSTDHPDHYHACCAIPGTPLGVGQRLAGEPVHEHTARAD